MCVRGELETEQTATYGTQVPLTIAAHLSHSAGPALQGVLRVQALYWELVLTASNCNSNSNKLDSNSGTGYIINCRPPASRGRRNCTEFNPSRVKVIYCYLRPEAPCFLTWWLGRWSICYRVNCIIVLLSSPRVPNWFYFAVKLTKPKTNKAPAQN